jgi:4-hydroxy-tetrahydrodipicolinate synthase
MFPIGQHVSKLSGYAPALPTPFHADGSFDALSFERYCDRQILEGANALVVCGTTGEAPTLTPAEHHRIVSIAVRVSQCRVPVIAGAGSNSTSHAIALSKDAEAAGADAVLSTVPYYNKPTQAGLYAHFRAIAEATSLPIILYDVPSRSACGLSDETIARLAELPQIIGLKDATGDVTRVARLRPRVGEHFRLLSGDDATALAYFTQGGNGCISVTANLAPGLCRGMFLACRQGQISRAQRLEGPVAHLTAMLFRESSPGPLKYALCLLGLMSPTVRLPIVQPHADTQAEIRAVLSHLCDGYQEQMIGAYEDTIADIRRQA